MSLTVETGAGVSGADSYAAVSFINEFWSARPHDPLSDTWAMLSFSQKEGCAREATSYLDGLLAPHYRGHRAGYLQGREWPRMEARDDQGFDLPDLPPQLMEATAALAPRAASGRLSEDKAVSATVKSETKGVDVLRKSIEYFEGGSLEKKFGTVMMSLAPILRGTEPGAGPSWNWR